MNFLFRTVICCCISVLLLLAVGGQCAFALEHPSRLGGNNERLSAENVFNNTRLVIDSVAPDINRDSAISFFKNFCGRYADAHYLSFRIRYTYADESNPSLVLDSLKGEIKMDKKNCHLLLGNMETISNSNYTVILFKQDTIMYLSKPQTANALFNPVSLVDSFLLSVKGLDISLAEKKGCIILTMDFPSGMDYKTAEFSIDSATGYLIRVKYLIKTTDLLNSATKAIAENGPMKNQWAVVESDFDNYETGQFTDSEFDDAKYFSKEGTEYITTNTYKHYKIFKASPDL